MADAKETSAGKKRGLLSLDLGLPGAHAAGGRTGGASAANGGAMGALLPKQLVDSSGTPTLEGLKLKLAENFTRLLAKLDDNGTQVAQVAESFEQRIHKRAKADHAKTCQVLQDSQSAIDMAAKQHAAALKQVNLSCKEACAALQQDSVACKEMVGGLLGQAGESLGGLRKKYGLKG